MRNLLLLFVFTAGITQLSLAQAKEASLEYLKTQQPGAVIEVPYAEDVVEGAIKGQFEKQGAKISNSKGLMIVKNATLEGQIVDLYFKIDRKSRKEKESTIVYLAAGHPGENLAIRSSGDHYGQAESVAYLSGLSPHIENHSIGLQVIEQEESLKKADKKYTGLISDSADFQKKKSTLEQKILDNNKALETQRVELEKQRQILEAIKARKKE